MIIQIPTELRSLQQWVVWKSIPNPDGVKPIKIPLNPRTLNPASVTDQTTWSSFLTAHRVLQNNSQLSGSGFVFTNSDPYTGIDLDNCKSDTIKPEASQYINLLDSYTEISPSGTGFHVICKGHLPPGGRKHGWIEMYDSGRFFCFTGNIWEQHKEITERNDVLAKFHKWVFTEQDRFDEVIKRMLYISDGNRHDAIRAEAWSMARKEYPLEETMEFCLRLGTINGFSSKRLHEVERMVYSAYDKNTSRKTGSTVQITERSIDIANIATIKEPDVDWIVPGLIGRGKMILLAGQTQVGKSLFTEYLSLAMSMGKSFGAWNDIKRSKVHYIDMENPSSRVNVRLKNFAKDFGGLPDEGQFIYSFAYNFCLTIESISRLLEHIQTNKIDVVVIDTYQRATPGINSYNDEKHSVIMQSLAKMCKETDCSVICIDHFRKLDERQKHFKKDLNPDDIKGSISKIVNADTVILLDRKDNELYMVIRSKDLEEGELHYFLDVASSPRYQVLTQD